MDKAPPESNGNGNGKASGFKLDFQTVGAAIVVGLGLWQAAIAPLQREVDRQEKALKEQSIAIADMQVSQSPLSELIKSLTKDVDRIDRVGTEKSSAQIAEISKEFVALHEALKEIETQFKDASHIANMRHERDFNMIRMLWHKTYAEDLPATLYNPEVGEVVGGLTGK